MLCVMAFGVGNGTYNTSLSVSIFLKPQASGKNKNMENLYLCVNVQHIKIFCHLSVFPLQLVAVSFFFFNLKLQKENPKRKHRPVCNTFIHKFLFYLALQPSYNLCSLYPLKYFHFLTLNILSSVY